MEKLEREMVEHVMRMFPVHTNATNLKLVELNLFSYISLSHHERGEAKLV